MKRVWLVLLVLLSLFSAAVSFADVEIGFVLDRQELNWNEEEYGSICVVNGRTLLPLRIISNLLGYEVRWDQETFSAIVVRDGDEYRFPIGQNVIITPRCRVVMDVPNSAENGRTYLPIRAFFETFDYRVEWLEKEIVAVRLKKAPDALARQHYVVVQGEEENPDTVGIPPMSDREKSVQKVLTALKKEYPDGLSWNNENRKYVWKNIVPGIHQYTGYGCVAFAFEITDRVFTDSDKAVYQDRVSDIRRRIKVGDILRMDGDTHSVVVIDRNKNGIVVAEGNYNEAVHWGREISYEELEQSLDYYYTRYH